MAAAEDQPLVTLQDIVKGLQAVGVGAGMRLMVHASLSSFGHVVGGPETVVAALQRVVTSQGTVMMPSFNHGSLFEAGGPGYYDPTTSITTNGTIASAFWQSPGVFRSLNPTHAFACWGRDAQRYVSAHHRTLTIGPDSPIGRLCQDGGYGLLLGVGYEANTLHHLAEYVVQAPCLGWRRRAYPVRLPSGRLVEGRTWAFRARKCPITDETRYARAMAERGLERVTTIGRCRVTLFGLRACLAVVVEMLQEGENGFPPCRRCPIRPSTEGPATESDWDRAKGRLCTVVASINCLGRSRIHSLMPVGVY